MNNENPSDASSVVRRGFEGLPWSRRQWSALMVVITVLILGLVAWTIPAWISAGLSALVALVVLQFWWLTVTVTQSHISAVFGLGLIRRRIALSTVAAYRQVRNRWYWGFGIRFYPQGRLYNIGGLDAVELVLNDQRRVRIGTDRAPHLIRALEVATGQPPSEEGTLPAPPRAAVWKYGGLVAVAALIPVALVVLFRAEERDPTVEVKHEVLTVESLLYKARLETAEITAATLISELPPVIVRTNGYALGKTLRGNFRLEGLGAGKLFLEADQPPYVMVTTNNSYVVFNFPDRQRTVEAHRRILAVLGNSGQRPLDQPARDH
jgi:hypothetical protein